MIKTLNLAVILIWILLASHLFGQEVIPITQAELETDQNTRILYLVLYWDVSFPEGSVYVVEERVEFEVWDLLFAAWVPHAAPPISKGRSYIPIGIDGGKTKVMRKKSGIYRVRGYRNE